MGNGVGCARVIATGNEKQVSTSRVIPKECNIQDVIHLVNSQTLGLRQEKVRPCRGNQHPGCKEVPGSVPE